jgi:outer membrane immunogenic protein
VTTVTPGVTSGHLTVDVVRAGASYMFGSPDGAPAARIDEARLVPTSWNGFYLGLHGGGGLGNDPFSQTGSGQLVRPDVRSAGWLAGGQAGANWQTGRWLAGMEIDISATGIKGSGTSPALEVFPGQFNSETTGDMFNLLGSARARLGWLSLPNLLVYGTGGLAWAQVTQDTIRQFASGGTVTTATTSQVGWRSGWTAGLGAEMRIGQSNWLGRIEYLHYDFGTTHDQIFVFSNAGASSFSEGRLTSDVLRVGLSYQLN